LLRFRHPFVLDDGQFGRPRPFGDRRLTRAGEDVLLLERRLGLARARGLRGARRFLSGTCGGLGNAGGLGDPFGLRGRGAALVFGATRFLRAALIFLLA
jgi:hypothetical protein